MIFPKQLLRTASWIAGVFALLPTVPILFTLIVAAGPDNLKNLALYSIPLLALGSPAAMILDRFGMVGMKFLALDIALSWLIYLVPTYVLVWVWYVWRTPGSLYRKGTHEE